MDPYIGKKLGNYEIVELIGKGGMASVYRAFQPSMNRHVAIKIMSRQISDDEVFVRRFKNEAQLIAQLEHAHILPVYDFGEESGVLYIVMRYLPTGSLAERIPPEGMPLEDAERIFSQIASALDYAHSRGIIHRDLKPGNILIDQQGNAFLTDFGIAKSLEHTLNLTKTDSVVGTPAYMSPEQALGEPLDARSDIYALGVVLFEMLTGKTPFRGDNPMTVMLKHINEPPPRPARLKAGIHQAVENVVLKSLAKRPDDRYQRAGDMAAALKYAVALASGDALPPTAPEIEKTVIEGPLPATRPAATRPGGGAVAAETAPSAVPGAEPTTRKGVLPDGAPAAATIPREAVSPPPIAAPPAASQRAALMAKLDQVEVRLNAPSAWLAEHAAIGTWLQAFILSMATFALLMQVTPASIIENAVLAVVPGLVLYGLLRAPTLGGLVGFVVVLIPLLVHAPAVALIWAAVTVIAGSRLNSREIMLALVTTVAAASPLGWLVPLLAPWWLRARRTALPVALGVVLAMLLALTLGSPDAGGLLPVPTDSTAFSVALLSPPTTDYLGLFAPQTWQPWTDIGAVVESIRATFEALGGFIARSNGLPLLIGPAWAVAAVLSVSNRRSESLVLHTMGLGLSLIVLLAAHLLFRQPSLAPVVPLAVPLAVGSVIPAFLLSQWPLQADPAAGNRSGTVLRLLRQSLGAVFVALGVAFFAPQLAGTDFYAALWLGGLAGALTMIVNPLVGPPIVFAALTLALVPVRPVQAVLVAGLLIYYLVVNLLFDRRRPRRWNPLGAGIILGAPGMAQFGLLPLGVLSIGALEAQVPAALLAGAGHVLLVATAANPPSALNVIIQVIATLSGALVVERLMGLELLSGLNHKLRRLIFTVPLAALLSLLYYTLGGLETILSLPAVVLVSMVSGAMLVGAMGKRAQFWRRFIEREEEEEGLLEDEEVTGPWEK
ncbi:MAG TPA: serine/threonine protein kinase [Chloroflexi bacterium]|nr:serine/threonine protein kinase [Chloroflexota bacterium]